MEFRRNHQFDPFSKEAASLPPLPDSLMESIDWNVPQRFGGLMGGNLPIPKQITP